MARQCRTSVHIIEHLNRARRMFSRPAPHVNRPGVDSVNCNCSSVILAVSRSAENHRAIRRRRVRHGRADLSNDHRTPPITSASIRAHSPVTLLAQSHLVIAELCRAARDLAFHRQNAYAPRCPVCQPAPAIAWREKIQPPTAW